MDYKILKNTLKKKKNEYVPTIISHIILPNILLSVWIFFIKMLRDKFRC